MPHAEFPSSCHSGGLNPLPGKPRFCQARRLSVLALLGFVLFLTSAVSEIDAELKLCLEEPDRVDRLNCFDHYHDTPLATLIGKEAALREVPPETEKYGPIGKLANQLEALRGTNIDQVVVQQLSKEEALHQRKWWEKGYQAPRANKRSYEVTQPSPRHQEALAKVEEALLKDENIPARPARDVAALERRVVVPWFVRARRWREEDLLVPSALKRSSFDEEQIGVRDKRTEAEKEEALSAKIVPFDVFMTVREVLPPDLRGQKKPAVLMLACENDITTIYLITDQPFTDIRAHVSYHLEEEGIVAPIDWHNLPEEKDFVLGAPRGLVSVEIIRDIYEKNRLILQVDQKGKSEIFVFNVSQLNKRVWPHMKACHWSPRN